MSWAQLTPKELIRACARTENAGVWSEFISRYNGIIRSAAMSVARRWEQYTSDECDDLVQEIYLKLCANECRALHALCDVQTEVLEGYLRIIATNSAHDYFRAKATLRRSATATESLSGQHEAVLGADQNVEHELILHEIEDVLDRETPPPNGPRDRVIFRLYYKHGMTAKEIAGMPGSGLSIKGVEGVIHRLTARIQQVLESSSQGSTRHRRLNGVGGD